MNRQPSIDCNNNVKNNGLIVKPKATKTLLGYVNNVLDDIISYMVYTDMKVISIEELNRLKK